MIEIELFYKTVESEMRRKHVKYLKRQKCLPSDRTEQVQSQDEVAASAADELVYVDNPKMREKVKRVKAFNKGIETALKVLVSEYTAYDKRLKKDEEGRKKF